jgi:hypothetical protein
MKRIAAKEIVARHCMNTTIRKNDCVTVDEINLALEHANYSVPGLVDVKNEDIGKNDEGLEEIRTIYKGI